MITVFIDSTSISIIRETFRGRHAFETHPLRPLNPPKAVTRHAMCQDSGSPSSQVSNRAASAREVKPSFATHPTIFLSCMTDLPGLMPIIDVKRQVSSAWKGQFPEGSTLETI